MIRLFTVRSEAAKAPPLSLAAVLVDNLTVAAVRWQQAGVLRRRGGSSTPSASAATGA